MSGAARHTPGPWEAFSNSLGVGVSARVADVARCDGFHVPTRGREEEEANARLIAAAPELLDGAKQVMALLEEHGGSIVPHLLDTDQNAGQRLRDAIAKAEGRS